MIDIEKIRKDFPMYNEHQGLFQGKKLIYLDNSATTFKPYQVIDAINHYYKDITSNVRRGDYSLAHEADVAYENARKKVAKFINADESECIFTSGDTMGLNMISYFALSFLNDGDEIVLSYEEHASNVLPWFKIAKITNAKIKYIPLDEHGKITVENFKSVLSSKTKIVSLATVSNILAHPVPTKELVKLTHSVNAIYIDDGAQAVPHMKYDVKDLDLDFLVFSGHKMLGPTGIGVLYGKRELLEKMDPLFFGGEMNARFKKDGSFSLEELPWRLEAGTQNIAGALGLAASIDYLENIGFDNIEKHEKELKKRAVELLKENKNIIIYNPEDDSPILSFNVKDVFSQDVATYLSSKGIFVRSGNHCSKLINNVLTDEMSARASFYIYNSLDDVNELSKHLEHAEDFLDAFFL